MSGYYIILGKALLDKGGCIMSYSFWDTVRGVELADTLIRTLPKLADGLESNKELLEEVKALRQDLIEIKTIIEKQ